MSDEKQKPKTLPVKGFMQKHAQLSTFSGLGIVLVKSQ
jgi:hypothetical protein